MGPKKFTEPVALLSTSPVNLWLPPTALGSGFDLLALRARCKREGTAWRGGMQVAPERFGAICGEFRLRRAGWWIVPCALRVHAKIHRAGGAFVHLPREPLASAYGPRERLRPTRAPCSVQERIYGLGPGGARGGIRGFAQFPRNAVWTARIRQTCRAIKRSRTMNSPSRWRFRPPPP